MSAPLEGNDVWQAGCVRNQCGIEMTTRRYPLVTVLDNNGSHLSRLEQSLGKTRKNKNKKKISLEKNVLFLAFHIWSLKLHVKNAGTLSGACPLVSKFWRDQGSPTSTVVAAFPSPYVFKLNPHEKLLEAEESWETDDKADVWRHMVSSAEGTSERQTLSPEADETWCCKKSITIQLRKMVIRVLDLDW